MSTAPRTIHQIEDLVSASAWSQAVPNDRSDSSWIDLKNDIGLSGPELSILKNSRFPIIPADKVLYNFRKALSMDALHKYINIGNHLKMHGKVSGVSNIEDGISQFVLSVPTSSPDETVVFAYLNGSSGLGKTELAFAFKRPVLYIPLGEHIYR
jgi:hypothetical protein